MRGNRRPRIRLAGGVGRAREKIALTRLTVFSLNFSKDIRIPGYYFQSLFHVLVGIGGTITSFRTTLILVEMAQ